MRTMKKTEQEFEKNSLLLFVLMMSANVCNYLFQIVMGNLMEVEQYAAGEYSSIVGGSVVNSNYNHYDDFCKIHCVECIKRTV